MRILLIDNDFNAFSELEDHYIVDVAHSGDEGAYLSQANDYSAVIVDECNAAFCEELRSYDETVPVLMLMNEEDLEKRLDSLNCGVDAVLTKPVSIRELQVYLRILINRANRVGNKNALESGSLQLDLNTRQVTRAGKVVPLRRKEYEILKYLMLNKGRVVTKTQILENAWDIGFDVKSNTLEVHIKTLRDKVDREFATESIKTVYGFGYRLI